MGRQVRSPDTSPCFTAVGIGVNDVLVYVRQLLAVMLQYICIIDRYRYLPVISGYLIDADVIPLSAYKETSVHLYLCSQRIK